MKMRRIACAVLTGFLLTGLALAKPEPTPDVTSGQLVGKIITKDGPKITVKGGNTTLKLIPHWRGGMPKDGGGFDKDMVHHLKTFSVGDQVRVDWVFSEHYRVEKIEKLGNKPE